MEDQGLMIAVIVLIIVNFLVGFTVREYMINKDAKKHLKKGKITTIHHYQYSKKYRNNRCFYNNLVWQGLIALFFFTLFGYIDLGKLFMITDDEE